MSVSTEEIAHVHFFFGFRLLGLGSFFLLGLLFFGSFLRGFLSCSLSSSRSRSSRCSRTSVANAFLSVSNELVNGFALEGINNTLDVLVSSVGANGSEERLDVIDG